jgi:hypothetical protein
LGGQVPVNDIALFILERPWTYNQDVTFTDPNPLLDFSFDPSHPGDTVIAPDPDMVCSLHQVGKCELFIGPFLGQTDTDRRRAIRIYCVKINVIVGLFTIIPNYNNSSFQCI